MAKRLTPPPKVNWDDTVGVQLTYRELAILTVLIGVSSTLKTQNLLDDRNFNVTIRQDEDYDLYDTLNNILKEDITGA